MGAGAPERPATAGGARAGLLALAVPVLLGALLWAPALAGFFAADDLTFLSRAAGLEPAPGTAFRWLSERLAWRLQYAAFGLEPLPWHAVRLAAHLVAVALVQVLGARLLGSRVAGSAAAILFATSPAAFTPVHWASALGEILMTVAALAACLVLLRARERGSPALLAGAGALWLLAVSAKETAVLLPLPLLVGSWGALRLEAFRALTGRSGGRRLAWGAAGVLLAVVGALAWASAGGRHLGGPAYSMSFAPAHLLGNLATYLAWTARVMGPIPDQVAAADPRALPAGLALAGAALAALAFLRRGPGRAGGFSAAWYLAFLLPVLPLASHSYAYYLYAPSAGACWFAAALGAAIVARWPGRTSRALVAASAVALVAGNLLDARARATRELNGLPADRILREARLLRNGVEGLRAVPLGTPDSVVFVSPFRRAYQDLAGRDATLRAAPRRGRTYVPFEAATRGGGAIPLFIPRVRVLGFGERLLPEWEAAACFVFADDGRLAYAGRGGEALRATGSLMLESGRWDLAEPTFRRCLALGDSSADASYGLLHALAGLGRDAEAGERARAFVARWPADPRSGALREWMASGAGP